MLAFDWSMLVKGYTHGGIGAGMSFEKQIIPHLSASAYFGQAVLFENSDGWGCYTFSPAGFVYYYPISRQLRKFYLATGFCWDLVFYFGDKIPEGARASSFSIYPQAGWKFSLPWRFLLDIFVGYKFAFNKNGVYYGNSADILGFGFQWGISFKHYMKSATSLPRRKSPTGFFGQALLLASAFQTNIPAGAGSRFPLRSRRPLAFRRLRKEFAFRFFEPAKRCL